MQFLPDDETMLVNDVTMTPLQAHVVGLGDKTAVADLNRRLFESSSRLQFSMKAPFCRTPADPVNAPLTPPSGARLQALDLGAQQHIGLHINLAARVFLIIEGLVSKLVTK